MALRNFLLLSVLIISHLDLNLITAEDDVKDFDFTPQADSHYTYEDYTEEISEDAVDRSDLRRSGYRMKPASFISKPKGITNSHRPQFNFDGYEDELYTIKPVEQLTESDVQTLFNGIQEEEEKISTPNNIMYSPSHQLRDKEDMIREAVVKALERKDHIKKFAQLLPIMKAMSSGQRLALASLVANQVSTPPGRKGLNLVEVRSMFGNSENATADLMLPILLDMANLFRKASRPGKEIRSVMEPEVVPKMQLLRRSDDADEIIWSDPEPNNKTNIVKKDVLALLKSSFNEVKGITKDNVKVDKSQTKAKEETTQKAVLSTTKRNNFVAKNRSSKYQRNVVNITIDAMESDNKAEKNSTTKLPLGIVFPKSIEKFNETAFNTTIKKDSDNSNTSKQMEQPVAEKLRAANRFTDKRAHPNRRQPWTPGSIKTEASRRATGEQVAASRRRPIIAKSPGMLPGKKENEQGNCELFTNTLCLDAEDYPTDAIVTSIRRNKAAAGALLADFIDQNQVDGVSAQDEAKYTPEHYLNLNRRGDSGGIVRDFASAGETGFMCPSTVKYARPQRARATSGQWKYIVNTGEHTQTLRLEKCLRPKEACTYLTDNFKSKCVQVYNYHRLLTWDQQNGLHMDIFKVPTCCSCHIEGYSVSFPPLGHRVQETSSEQYPGDEIVNENAFENGQSTMIRPNIQTTPFGVNKPVDSFSMFSDNQNSIAGNFNGHTFKESDEYNPPTHAVVDSYGNSYLPESFKPTSSHRNIKKPVKHQIPDGIYDSTATLPSYLEPPSESSMPVVSTFFGKGPESGKINKYPIKYVRPGKRPHRRPIRKNISKSEDMLTAGSMQYESQSPTATLIQHFDDMPRDENIGFEMGIVSNRPSTETPTRKLLHKLPIYTTSTTEVPKQSEDLSGGKDNAVNKQRVNYNYHPIIDFFENNNSKGEAYGAIDRGDSVSTFNPETEDDWRPMSMMANVKNNNIGRATSS